MAPQADALDLHGGVQRQTHCLGQVDGRGPSAPQLVLDAQQGLGLDVARDVGDDGTQQRPACFPQAAEPDLHVADRAYCPADGAVGLARSACLFFCSHGFAFISSGVWRLKSAACMPRNVFVRRSHRARRRPDWHPRRYL